MAWVRVPARPAALHTPVQSQGMVWVQDEWSSLRSALEGQGLQCSALGSCTSMGVVHLMGWALCMLSEALEVAGWVVGA
jgi:hypothetical protein